MFRVPSAIVRLLSATKLTPPVAVRVEVIFPVVLAEFTPVALLPVIETMPPVLFKAMAA